MFECTVHEFNRVFVFVSINVCVCMHMYTFLNI